MQRLILIDLRLSPLAGAPAEQLRRFRISQLVLGRATSLPKNTDAFRLSA
jgi:hypothetical protein